MAKNDVTVKITQKQVIGNAGFKFPLIVQGKAGAEKAYGEYSGLDELAKAGYGDEDEIYRQCEKLFMQDNRPDRVAICAGSGKITEILNTLKAKDFRQVIPVFGEEDDTLGELASYIEATEDKMLFVKVADKAELSTLGQLDRTFAIVYGGESKGVEGAVVGATAGMAAGSYTYKNQVLKGVLPEELTDGQIEEIHQAGGICIVRKAGDVVTSEGTVLSGEYADVIDSKDYIIRNIAYKSQKLLNASRKLSFDNIGISMLEGVVTGVLKEAYHMGMIAVDEDGVPICSADFASREETSESDRAQRVYKGGRFSFTLAGAIHYAEIRGTLEV